MENSSSENVNTSSKSIQAIDKKAVHQICSGQVVLDLATAVKELVENSIDGGATNIEIRLRDYGTELIEVSDNGEGIKEADFEVIALKHYTSKLREFNDLPSVNTFGFRGEALSSLSALGDLTIITHNASVEVGSKLTFDHDGKLIDRCLTASQEGTTVSISNLFYTLPVRHKEFHRNYKKDFSKLVNVLYAFCLVNSNVRINCVNQVGNKRNKFISTNGKNSILDTISSIFGATQMKNIIKIEQREPLDTILEEYNISKDVFSNYQDMFLIDGYVSSVKHGYGRSVADRQFFFINNRPCDFPKLGRVINDVYHAFNQHQYPFIFLNMLLNKDYVDINVTPDKRQIMIQQENVLIIIVKSALKHMFEVNATFYAETKQSNHLSESQMTNASPINNFLTPPKFKYPDETTTSIEKSKVQNILSSTQNTSSTSPLDRFRSKFEKSPLWNGSNSIKKQKIPEQVKLMSFFNMEPKKRKFDDESVDSKAKKALLESCEYKMNEDYKDSSFVCLDYNAISDGKGENAKQNNHFELLNCESGIINSEAINELDCKVDISLKKDDVVVSKTDDDYICIVDEVANDISLRNNIIVNFNLKMIQDNYSTHVEKSNENPNKNLRSFHAKISVSENESAETELGRNVTKEMFNIMEIIGQFNLGFIIIKLRDDLFIVDQHASDEKYNYETLQQKHCLKGQRLIQPLPINLTLVNENILLDNLEIFQKNGFDFEINEDKNEEHDSSHGQHKNKINLLTVPTSRNWTFSVDDVEELIFLLSDSPGVMCRPSRVHKMFASRACRKSVMVGTALNMQKMKTLISHMSEINHPWNCPHGRPTMRHLINLNRIDCK